MKSPYPLPRHELGSRRRQRHLAAGVLIDFFSYVTPYFSVFHDEKFVSTRFPLLESDQDLLRKSLFRRQSHGAANVGRESPKRPSTSAI
jgi:hypothetical protein